MRGVHGAPLPVQRVGLPQKTPPVAERHGPLRRVLYAAPHRLPHLAYAGQDLAPDLHVQVLGVKGALRPSG